MMNSIFEFFQLRKVLKISAEMQIAAIVFLYITMTIGHWFSVQKTGAMDGYPPSVSILFVPIYEELVFRGILLKFFEKNYGVIKALVVVSVLFGLWHIKNIFWLDLSQLFRQIAYTTFIFSPFACWITLKTRSVWPAVILHYINNFPLESWIQKIESIVT